MIILSHFNDIVSTILDRPITDDVAIEMALNVFDQIAASVRLHRDEIDSQQLPAYEAANYSNTNNQPVFILLTKGHTILSTLIYKATHDEHSHASIAFDIKLNDIYSFGTKKLIPKREMGFVHISYDSDIWGDIPTAYDLYVTFIDQQSKDKIMKALQYFTKNADKLSYHWMGLIKIFFNIKDSNKKKFICSRFVASLLGEGNVKMERDSSLYRPSQLRDIDNVEFVISGPSIRDYDWRAANRELKRVMQA